jgi:hypothetical protein
MGRPGLRCGMDWPHALRDGQRTLEQGLDHVHQVGKQLWLRRDANACVRAGQLQA